jgi:intermediate peptidase
MQHHFKSVYQSNSGSFENQSNWMSIVKQNGLRIVTDSGNLSLALRWISDEEVSVHRAIFCASVPQRCINSIEQYLDFLCHHSASLLIDSTTLSVMYSCISPIQ